MKTKKQLSYLIIVLCLIFIPVYLFDCINEFYISPLNGLGFPYKYPGFYILKLIYTCIFLLGGIKLLKDKKTAWSFLVFSSVGMLISPVIFFISGSIFRVTILDEFLLEIPSIFIIILFNKKSFTEKYDIRVPKKRWMLLGVILIINLVLNYAAWWADIVKCWLCPR